LNKSNSKINMIRSLIFFILLSILMMPYSVIAGAIKLSQTGQITSYLSGDDGDIQSGIPWPVPRFVSTGYGTLTDNLTGIMWTRDANAIGQSQCNYSTPMTWHDALDYIKCLNKNSYLGFIDWRLPNANELQSLINLEEPVLSSWLNGQGYLNVQEDFYWSSTTTALSADSAWGISMKRGFAIDFPKNEALFVWPVRGLTNLPALIWKTGQTISYSEGDDGDHQMGIPLPAPRFIDHGDGTITDCLTGLMWLKDSSCLGINIWENTSLYITDFNAHPKHYSQWCYDYTASYNDWRLPNFKELQSLIDYSRYEPPLPLGHPFKNVQSNYFYYWTSSTYANDITGAWSVDMWYGKIYPFYEELQYFFWPVRGGRDTIFIDIASGFPTEDYINALFNNGITTGWTKDDLNTPQNEARFCPEELTTREQMAAFIIRAVEGEPPSNYCDSGLPFPDVTSNMWSCRYIKRLKELGITTGYGDGRYGPLDTVTREQMAAFIVRAKEGEPPDDYCGSIPPFTDVSPESWACKYIKRLKELGITTGYGDGTFGPLDILTRAQMAAFLARAFLGME